MTKAELKTYRCASCGLVYETETTDEAAFAEAEALFGEPVSPEDAEPMCDPCYQRFLKWFESLTPEDHRAIRAGERRGFP